jgi:hypothetical protein
MTNDLNEREDQIIAYKKREVLLEQRLSAKEKLYEQDTMVRLQLGKKLEQVLLDKEDLREQIESLQVKLRIHLFRY